jgi:hypothetical protein
MKKETQKTESVKVEAQDFYMSSKEAAAYLGLDYCNFRKQRNKGYFGRDRYPAPDFCFIGIGEQGIRYLKSDLDRWRENFPRHNNVALAFKKTAEAAVKFKASEEFSDER